MTSDLHDSTRSWHFQFHPEVWYPSINVIAAVNEKTTRNDSEHVAFAWQHLGKMLANQKASYPMQLQHLKLFWGQCSSTICPKALGILRRQQKYGEFEATQIRDFNLKYEDTSFTGHGAYDTKQLYLCISNCPRCYQLDFDNAWSSDMLMPKNEMRLRWYLVNCFSLQCVMIDRIMVKLQLVLQYLQPGYVDMICAYANSDSVLRYESLKDSTPIMLSRSSGKAVRWPHRSAAVFNACYMPISIHLQFYNSTILAIWNH